MLELKVSGPIVVTHTDRDHAVGRMSRISRDNSSAFGDANDRYGGLGRHGAVNIKKEEFVQGRLLAETAFIHSPPARSTICSPTIISATTATLEIGRWRTLYLLPPGSETGGRSADNEACGMAAPLLHAAIPFERDHRAGELVAL